MFNLHQVVLDRKKKLSESFLWEFQRSYFEDKGVNAWSGDVPYYVTSNPYLADCYAHLSIRLIQDWARKYPESQNHPFYIMELGTGCGRLSFYILKQIKALQKQLRMDHLSICYVMTDFTESNLTFWNQQPQLQSFLEEKRLDFALFDMEKDTTLQLRKAGITLGPDTVHNPIIVYANYIFDTVPSDAFFVDDQKVYASLLSLSTERQNMDKGKPISMDKVHLTYKKVPAERKYYKDEVFNTVLHSYKDTLKHSHILFPIVGLRAVSNLKKLSGGKMLMISSDKGHSTTEELDGLEQPHISFHGSFSVMVNFHAIAEYFKQSGGNAVLQSARSSIKTNLFYQGFELEDLPELNLAVQEYAEGISPGDYFILHSNIRDNFEKMNLTTLVSHLAFARWDPHIFQRLSTFILDKVASEDQKTVEYLLNHINNLADNFYQMPVVYNVFYDLGRLCQLLHRYADAVKYYQKSIHYFGETENTSHNLSMCRQKLNPA